MAFTAVWAHQSPTLLNILKQSDQWSLRVVDLGDCNFQERSLLKADVERPEDISKPDAVFVCSPGHMTAAKQAWPNARIVWVFHQGYTSRVPTACLDGCQGAVAFHDAIAKKHSRVIIPTQTLVPYFEVSNQWKYKLADPYLIMSRPQTRRLLVTAAIRELQQAVEWKTGRRVWWYGEQAPDGFAPSPSELYAQHSCYLTRLPWKSGLGLAEHEAMAAGMPVVGPAWAAYCEHWNENFTYCDTDALADIAEVTMINDCGWSDTMSQVQRAYIEREYSREKMNDSVEQFVDTFTNVYRKWLVY